MDTTAQAQAQLNAPLETIVQLMELSTHVLKETIVP